MPYLSASAVVIHYEEALYQVYVPIPLPQTGGKPQTYCSTALGLVIIIKRIQMFYTSSTLLDVRLLVVTIWSFSVCTSYSSGCHHSPPSSSLASTKIHNGDVLVPANGDPSGKWPLKRRGSGQMFYATVIPDFHHYYLYVRRNWNDGNSDSDAVS